MTPFINETNKDNKALQVAKLPLSDIAMPVIIVDKDRRIVEVNSRAAFLFGWDSPSGLMGQDLHVLIPGSKRKAHALAFAEWIKAPSHRSMAGPGALVEGRHLSGRSLHLRVALQWLPKEQLAVALIQALPRKPMAWWKKPKAVVGFMFLTAGTILALAGVAYSENLLAGAFGMLIALAGKGDQPERTE